MADADVKFVLLYYVSSLGRQFGKRAASRPPIKNRSCIRLTVKGNIIV